MKSFASFIVVLLGLGVTTSCTAADSDDDGLLDLVDVPAFDPNASEIVELFGLGIQDLDGVRELTNAHTIYLSHNKITSIEAGDFAELANLQQLSLSYNQLMSIEGAGFQGLTSLVSLDLLGNSISSLNNDTFHGVENLHSLNLGSNQVSGIENNTFQGVSDLRWLYLANNRLSSIEVGIFQGPTNLTSLNLRNNQIVIIESGAFEQLGVQYLELTGNRITTIESDVFKDLTLKWLGLEANQIASIEHGAFRRFENLQTLLLQNNELTELDLTNAAFDRLSSCSRGVDGSNGFCVDGAEISSLSLDNAKLSQGAFEAIIGETSSITDVSLIGLKISGGDPADLDGLLRITTLDSVTVDQNLFQDHETEFNGFDAMDGNTLTIVRRGDANSDGEFNSFDFVLVYEAGEYEDDVDLNSTWSTGDWSGDGDFTTADLVLAFQQGGYEREPRVAATVPEPTAPTLMLIGPGLFIGRRRRCDTTGC